MLAKWGRVVPGIVVVGLLAGGCAQTSRVDQNAATPTALATSKKSIALMRIGAASPECVNVAIQLGVRVERGFRPHQVLRVAHVRSLNEAPVAEVELDPGEYHVVAYQCLKQRGVATIASPADAQTYRSSYASFRLEPGEIVNVGYLHFHARRISTNAFGRPLEIRVDVTDWPLAEIDRFKTTRPAIYAQMKTRLMAVTDRGAQPPDDGDCARLAQLKAEGKVAQLPASCTPAAQVAPKRKA